MLKIKVFDLSLGGWLLRFYLMMIVALVLGFTGLLWLAVPVTLFFAITCIMGISVRWEKKGTA